MFGIFKRKDKEETGQETETWGQPSNRKLSKNEAARDAAEQKLIEEKNQERRQMYRPAGVERIFTDTAGRRLALRYEDNTGPQSNPHHPPITLLAFWGVREIGTTQAEVNDKVLRQLQARVENGYEGRGIASEMLKELETIARQKEVTEICLSGVDGNEWNTAFLAQAGYTPRETEMVKAL